MLVVLLVLRVIKAEPEGDHALVFFLNKRSD